MAEKKDSIKELLEKNANRFHFEVVNFLRDNSWEVLISPYYKDNITEKPREIDIIAEKEFPVKGFPDRFAEKEIGNVNVKLFIECKYIKNSILFWFDKKDEEKARKRVEKDLSPLKLPESEAATIYKHHYLNKEQVAKLSESTKNKTQEHEIIYKALNQSLNAMIYYKNTPPIISKVKGNGLSTFKTINYPLILCNSFDKFYRVTNSEGKTKYSKILGKSFQLEVNYVYFDKLLKGDNVDYFLIDIIDFVKFNDFLHLLKTPEIDSIVEMERRQVSHR